MIKSKSELGKKLQQLEFIPTPVKFDPVDCRNFPLRDEQEMTDLNFSQDQNIFFRLCCAVITGNVPEDLIGRKLGLLNHSRWLTLGSRILCLYIMTKKPCRNLCRLAHFTIRGYASVWFLSRMSASVTQAPKILFDWVKEISRFDKVILDAALPIVNNGSYWFHSENILLAALADPRPETRIRAVEQIMKIRYDKETQELARKHQHKIKQERKCAFKRQRVFVKPIPNCEAEDYIDVIDWKTEALYEPPFTQELEDNVIKSYIENPLVLDVSSNSVLTERTIRDIDQVATQSTSPETRGGMIRAMKKDREEHPSFNKK